MAENKQTNEAYPAPNRAAASITSAGSNATTTTTTNSSSGNSGNNLENVKVAVRLRPFTEKERQRNCKRCVDIEQNTVAIYSPKYDENIKKFTFDHSYWSHDGFRRSSEGVNTPDPDHPNSNKYVGQERVFEDLGRFLLANALKGYNSALLAYGQTGSGKSYTVSGYGKNEGILARFARELFAELDRHHKSDNSNVGLPPEGCLGGLEPDCEPTESSNGQATGSKLMRGQSTETLKADQPADECMSSSSRYEVYFSMLEIYNEVVRDLLAKSSTSGVQTSTGGSVGRRGLRVREHPKRGFFVESLTSIACANKGEIGRLIEEGQLNKSIAATSMNETSSRGHTIYEFHIKQYRKCHRNEPAKEPPLADGRASGISTKDQSERTSKRRRGEVETLTTSVVQLVDLAGSERMAVHVNGQDGRMLTNETFIGSRSSSPFAREQGSKNRTPNKRLPPSSAESNSAQPGATTSSSSSSSLFRRNQRETQAASNTSSNAHSSHLSLPSNHQQRFKESVSINQSLSALGNCIQVLSQYSQQQASAANQQAAPKIPYRDSVLTKLLNRCCLSGNSKVVLIATLSPAEGNYDDTLSTLRFADRAKQIRTHATINKQNRGEVVNALQRENERLKQILDGRVTRSDDSSQTSNFDDTENMQDNFNGPKVAGKSSASQREPATKSRTLNKASTAASRAQASPRKPKEPAGSGVWSSAREPKQDAKTTAPNSLRAKRTLSKSTTRLAGELAANEQMKQLVSPAASKALNKAQFNGLDERQARIRKSRSLGQGLAATAGAADEEAELDLLSGMLDEIELNDELINNLDEENLLSPDSDDSFALPPGDEKLSNEEKINILNKLLSNTNVASKMVANQQRRTKEAAGGKLARPKKAGATQHISTKSAGLERELNRVSAISSALKRNNPYLSNLNPDEQLTGMITYIIKPGETIVGKNQSKCDLLIYGPELRARHAKLERIDHYAEATKEPDKDAQPIRHEVFIEPIPKSPPSQATTPTGVEVGEPKSPIARQQHKVALLVNGEPVLQKTKLNHCDRLLFGSNAYFVFIDNTSKQLAPNRVQGQNNTPTNSNGVDPQLSNKSSCSGDTLADLDMITYDMAHNEVLRKIMSDAQNEAMIREINEYTHRPGTGKHRKQLLEPGASGGSPAKTTSNGQAAESGGFKMSRAHNNRLTRSLTVHDDQVLPTATPNGLQNNKPLESPQSDTQAAADQQPHQLDKIKEEGAVGAADPVDESYREKLMEDTYEFAMPVAEANAIAREMSIKVTYGLKILTGEEQLLTQNPINGELMSTGDPYEAINDSIEQQPSENSVAGEQIVITRNSIEPASLDIAPQLYIHVHLEELQLDFYWSKEKFQERRVKMLELYGAWDVGGKSGLVEYLIEQSKYQGYYMIDPFVDDIQSSFVLVGHAQVALQPISHRSELRDTFDVLDVNDEIVGSIQIEAIPCHSDENVLHKEGQSPFRLMSESELADNFVEQPQRFLLGNKFVFLFKIVACSNISAKYSRLMCQYTLNRDKQVIRTSLLTNSHELEAQGSDLSLANKSSPGHSNKTRNSNATYLVDEDNSKSNQLAFNHSHFVVIDRMDDDVLDFLQHGFLTIQLVGQYRWVTNTAGELIGQSSSSLSNGQPASATSSNSSSSANQPTLIWTIINSINKYRFRMEQQEGGVLPNQQTNLSNMDSNPNYPGSIYANSLTDSAKSNRITSSGIMNSNSAASSITSASATINLFDQQNDDDEGTNSLNGISQENIIDMILTKRKLDRAENQLHYLKRTINIAEHYNRKHIPIKTVKKLLTSYGQELESGSLEEMAADVASERKTSTTKQSGCLIQ